METAAGLGGRPFRIAGLVCLSLALVYAGPGLLPGRVLLPLDLVSDYGAWKPDPQARIPVSNHLLSDPVLQFHPWDVEMRRSLSGGQIPWRNRYSGDGSPLFANPQAALFSPFTWPRLVLGERGWAVSVSLKLLLGGLGLWLFARELSAGIGAALFSAVVYELSGFSILWGLHPHTNVFAFLPWVGAAGHRLLFRPSAGAALGLVLSAALATAGGHPETLAFGTISISLFLLAAYRAHRRALASRASARSAALAILAGACGFSLLAIQLVPFALTLAESRIVELRAHPANAGFRSFAVAGQILPGFLGSPLAGELDLSGALYGSGNMNIRSGAFVGFTTIVAILLAARSLDRVLRRVLLVAFAALAISWCVPPLGWLWDRVPALALLAPEYAAAGFVLLAALASGPALEALRNDGRSLRVPGGALVLAGILLVAAGLLPSLPAARPALASAARAGIDRLRARGYLKHPAPIYEARFAGYLATGRVTALRRLALPGGFWILGGAALLSRRRRLSMLSLAVVGELAGFGLGYIPAVPRSRVPGPPPAIADLRRRSPGLAEMIAASPDVYPPDLATLDGLRDVRSFGLLETRERISRLDRCGYDEFARGFPESLTAEAVACLAGAGVRYFVSRQPPPGSTRVGGGAPPAVGAYELPRGAPAPPPREGPPRGLIAGALLSLIAAIGAILVVKAAGRLAV